MAEPERLFVYGTLAPGRPNEHLLADMEGTWGPASVKGKLRDAGWGAATGYPGIDLDETAEEVRGFVFTSASLADNWKTLDAFEGGTYERVLTSVTTGGGQTVAAYIYVLK